MGLTAATTKDIKKIYDWRNSFSELGNGQKVSFDTHIKWFNKVLADKNKKIFIIDECGAVRLDREGNQAEISIYISEHMQGKGLGRQAISEATEIAFELWDIEKVVARVKIDNNASANVFSMCGYGAEGHDNGEYILVARGNNADIR